MMYIESGSHSAACYTHLTYAKDYYFTGHHVYAVPNFNGSALVSCDVLHLNRHSLWITASAKFNSHFYMATLPQYDGEEVSPSAIFDLGARYQCGRNLSFMLNCENLFNKTTYMSGALSTVMPWFKPARTLMASVKIKL